MVKDKSYVRATFTMRFLSLAAMTTIPIILRSNHLSVVQIGLLSAAIWLGSGLGTIISMVRPMSLWKASLLGIALTSMSFAAISRVVWVGLFFTLGLGLSMVEIPSLDAARSHGSTGIYSYYSSLGLATLIASTAMPVLLYASRTVALLILAIVPLLGVPADRSENHARPFSDSHLMKLKQNYAGLFVSAFLVYMAYYFVTTFFGVRLMELGYPAWLSQGSFIAIFLTSFLIRLLHPAQLIGVRRLMGISLLSFLALTLPMPMPILGLVGLGLSHGLFPVAISLKLVSEHPSDFAVVNVVVLSSTGFASFLAPLIGGYTVSALGFSGTVLLFSAFLLPLLMKKGAKDEFEG
ncbi:MAG: hypothetical protein ACP5GO_05515 [Thermoprotei archaeon]